MNKKKFGYFLTSLIFFGYSSVVCALEPGEDSFNKALELAIQGQFVGAKTMFEKSEEFTPRLGSLQDYLTIIDDAISKKIKRKTAIYLYNAFLEMNKIKYNLALNELNKAIKNNPGYSISYFSRGYVYRMDGKNKEAILDFKKALTLNKKVRGANHYLADIYFKEGMMNLALNEYTKSIKLNAKNVFSFLGRAEVYNEIGKHSEALQDIDKAIALRPKMTGSYSYRAYTHWVYLNDLPQACVYYKKACDLGSCDYYDSECK